MSLGYNRDRETGQARAGRQMLRAAEWGGDLTFVRTLRHPSVLPGFAPALGFTLLYLGLIVLIPLAGLIIRSAGLGWADFWHEVGSPRAVASYRLSFGAAFFAAAANAVFGLLVAWVLVRYRFPFKRLIDALVDLPFALPTAVAGITLTELYADSGWAGSWLAKFGIHAAFNPIGIVIALIFVGLPFVVRTVEPVLQDLDTEVEEAAASLGARRWQVFLWIVLPSITPALLTGFALAFARGLGEYGSVIFIAGNMPMRSEITPLLIVIKLEQYDYAGAAAIAVVMLIASFVLLFVINLLQRWSRSATAQN
jgi:sulfate transport system permease protein